MANITITMTGNAWNGGTLLANGASVTIPADLAEELIARGLATYSGTLESNPTTPDARFATDASGNVTGLVGPNAQQFQLYRNGARPRYLVFGNSLAGQSVVSMAGSTTTLSVAASAGALTVTVASIGTIASGNKIAIGLYDGTVHATTVNGAPVGNVVTLAVALPKMARSGANFQVYTSVNVPSIRRSEGPIYQGLAILGQPCELVQGYGYGGGLMDECTADLPRVLEAIRPRYVHLMTCENTIGSATVTSIVTKIKAQIEIVLSYGAIPLVNVAFPSTVFSTAGISAVYDAYNAYVLGQMVSDYPSAVAIDVGRQWLDSAFTTQRRPLSGWTDGVHPNTTLWVTIGKLYMAALKAVVSAKSIANTALTSNSTLTGTGGTGSNMVGGSVIPDSWTFSADAGVTCTTARNSDGSLNLQMSVPGTSNISSTRMLITQLLTLPASGSSSGQAVLGYVKFKANTMTGIDLMYCSITFSGSEAYSSGQDTFLADTGIPGQTLQWETPIVPVPLGATTINFQIFIRPTTGLSNGVTVNLDLIEAGITPASYVTH